MKIEITLLETVLLQVVLDSHRRDAVDAPEDDFGAYSKEEWLRQLDALRAKIFEAREEEIAARDRQRNADLGRSST